MKDFSCYMLFKLIMVGTKQQAKEIVIAVTNIIFIVEKEELMSN